MKSKSNGYPRLTIYMICISHMIFASIQLCKGSTIKEEGNERILSRRRRYLIFPEGSSLQIVYDTYHPVVDYTNLLVVGITGALAWELPSKPVYLEQQLQEIYKSGSLPLLRRNDEIVDDERLQGNNTSDAVYNHEPYLQIKQPIYVTKPTDDANSNEFKQYLYYDNNSSKNPTLHTSKYNHLEKGNLHSFKKLFSHFPPQHHQYMHPMFGKRSTSDGTILTAEQKFHLENHRRSRHNLYKHLEKFIDTTGYNGQDCVLKALCETGQSKQDGKPRSFLGEIMKAVFSLPDLQLIQRNAFEGTYDAAHRVITNCAERYSKCNRNLWKTIFQ